jgi:hypothetical protein
VEERVNHNYPLPPCFAKRGCKLLKRKGRRSENRAKRRARGCRSLKIRELTIGVAMGRFGKCKCLSALQEAGYEG